VRDREVEPEAVADRHKYWVFDMREQGPRAGTAYVIVKNDEGRLRIRYFPDCPEQIVKTLSGISMRMAVLTRPGQVEEVRPEEIRAGEEYEGHDMPWHCNGRIHCTTGLEEYEMECESEDTGRAMRKRICARWGWDYARITLRGRDMQDADKVWWLAGLVKGWDMQVKREGSGGTLRCKRSDTREVLEVPYTKEDTCGDIRLVLDESLGLRVELIATARKMANEERMRRAHKRLRPAAGEAGTAIIAVKKPPAAQEPHGSKGREQQEASDNGATLKWKDLETQERLSPQVQIRELLAAIAERIRVKPEQITLKQHGARLNPESRIAQLSDAPAEMEVMEDTERPITGKNGGDDR
jgi:hypothetical protein